MIGSRGIGKYFTNSFSSRLVVWGAEEDTLQDTWNTRTYANEEMLGIFTQCSSANSSISRKKPAKTTFTHESSARYERPQEVHQKWIWKSAKNYRRFFHQPKVHEKKTLLENIEGFKYYRNGTLKKRCIQENLVESVGGRESLVIWKETFKTYVDIIDILQKRTYNWTNNTLTCERNTETCELLKS